MFDLRNKKFALIDMDGVLYDSMPYHTLSWQRMITELGLSCTREEFYLYEGMTGRDTIDVIFQRELGRRADPEEARRLYERKARYFVEYGPREMMPGADRMIRALMDAGIGRVLVTDLTATTPAHFLTTSASQPSMSPAASLFPILILKVCNSPEYIQKRPSS